MSKAKFGEKHPNTKLTQDQVDGMRYKCWFLNISRKDLMGEYDMSKGGITHILNNKKPQAWNPNNLTTEEMKCEFLTGA